MIVNNPAVTKFLINPHFWRSLRDGVVRLPIVAEGDED